MENSLYYILHTPHKQSGVAFAFCGVSQTKPNHSFGPALRNAYIIHIVLNGMGTLRIDDTVYSLEKNDCFVIQPDDSAEYRASAEDPWTYCWLGFTASDPDEYLSAIGYTPRKHAFRVTAALPFLNLLTECFSYTDGSVRSELKLNSITFELLFRLASNRVSLDPSSSTRPLGETIVKAMQYIDEHYGDGITASGVAEYLHVDRSYLSREFHAANDMTMKEYIDHIRIGKASDLLSMTDMSIAEIAKRCGYGSAEVFSRKFKESQDATPLRYRQLRSTINNDLEIDIDFLRALFQH